MVKKKKGTTRVRQRGPAPVREGRHLRSRGRAAQIVRVEPPKGQLRDYLGLTALAFLFKTTIYKICGAIRALKFRNDDTLYDTSSRGAVIGRQQTMVHKSKLKFIQNYLETGTRTGS